MDSKDIEWIITIVIGFVGGIVVPLCIWMVTSYRKTQLVQFKRIREAEAKFENYMTKDEVKSHTKHKVKEGKLELKCDILEKTNDDKEK